MHACMQYVVRYNTLILRNNCMFYHVKPRHYVTFYLLLLILQAMLKSYVKKTCVHMYVAMNTHLIPSIKSPSNFHAIVIQVVQSYFVAKILL